MKEPDLKKKLIVQSRKLEQGDLQGYFNADYLKEHQVTLAQLQGKDYEYDSDDSGDVSDESLNEFWKIEGKELERQKQKLKEERVLKV